jgi:serine/threonine-protein kinase
LFGATALFALLVAALTWRDGVVRCPARPAAETLAVLPFHDVGGGHAEAAISAGLGEIVTNGLRQLEQLRGSLQVVASSDVLKERVSSAREARAAFGATRALEGSIHWGPQSVTVAVNLVDAKTLLVLDARKLEVPRAEAASLHRLLVERVAGMLRLEGEGGLPADPAPAPGAYEFYLQGRGYLQRYDRVENLDSAIAVLDLALARDPDYALAHAGKAEAHLRRFQLTKDPRFLADARASAAHASALAPRLAAVQLTAGIVHAAAGELSDAVRSFERALEIEPASAEAHRELARAYDAAGRTEQAEATYLRAIELRPGSWASYKDLGVFYNRHGRLAEALPMFQRVVELTPDNYAGYANLGGLHLRLGQHDEAAAMLERSLALRPTAQGHANLGTVHFYQGRYAQAARAYRSATALNPTDSRLWGNLGDAERWSGQAEEAAEAYRKAVELLGRELEVNPRSAEPWSRLAIHEAALGRTGEALASIEKALRLEPRDGQVLFRSALVHEEAGRRERALEAVQAALDAGYSPEEIGKAPPLQALREDPRYRAFAQRPMAPGEGPR